MKEILKLIRQAALFYIMSVVSGIIPFVVAYIYYAWRKIDHNKLTEAEITTTEHKY